MEGTTWKHQIKQNQCLQQCAACIWGDMGQDGIGMWRRERHPHMLILLMNILSLIFLPPFLPPNDRLRKADL